MSESKSGSDDSSSSSDSSSDEETNNNLLGMSSSKIAIPSEQVKSMTMMKICRYINHLLVIITEKLQN